jgi:hypothetical protein
VKTPAPVPTRLPLVLHFFLRELIHRPRQIREMERLNGLDAECYFVDDHTQSITRPSEITSRQRSCWPASPNASI